MGVDAFEIYKLATSGYCCSQIMMLLYLKENNLEDEALVKAMSGLCGGIGINGRTCGVITAGACILGLYAGKGTDTESNNDNLKKMIRKYIEWFEEQFEGTDCVDIISVDALNDINEHKVYPIKCGNIIQKSYNKLDTILREFEFIL